ncbi:hypothetical protein C1637_25040 [Chryseobacterium lactis]|uniref:Uncharacterized protein n=2 Tax=Chryseobacterium TaxID=59732 RepID=A0AA91YCF4_CHRLC|nr:hypothetical protein C1637_25040 [Chryseobacterium lactis]
MNLQVWTLILLLILEEKLSKNDFRKSRLYFWKNQTIYLKRNIYNMKDFIKQLKPHPVAIVGTLILLAGVIIYSVTVKKNVEVQIPDYFIFKATD